jgi:hypothetical protein
MTITVLCAHGVGINFVCDYEADTQRRTVHWPMKRQQEASCHLLTYRIDVLHTLHTWVTWPALEVPEKGGSKPILDRQCS